MSRSEGSDDGFARWLDSRPIEDEEISTGELAAIDEAHAELAAGVPTVSLDAFRRELGAWAPRGRTAPRYVGAGEGPDDLGRAAEHYLADLVSVRCVEGR